MVDEGGRQGDEGGNSETVGNGTAASLCWHAVVIFAWYHTHRGAVGGCREGSV